ncbi:Uncharacterised protein [Mycobacteroides abscessus subsp. abscessus]|nr:Uncharacterised protein [Mycobacteroides abscessus subsp. abscessus]
MIRLPAAFSSDLCFFFCSRMLAAFWLSFSTIDFNPLYLIPFTSPIIWSAIEMARDWN